MEENGKKKMGRPTTDPKTHVARLRLSEEEYVQLERCCQLTGKNKTDVLKLGIELVYQEAARSHG